MKCNRNIQSVILNLIQDLQRRSLSLLNGMRGRCQIKFGMTPLFNNGAFTLIELLVVVLIIGILAAVALPQYQVAVLKSRFIKLYNLAMTYDRVIQEYELANGTYPTSFDALAIDKLTGTTTANIGNIYSCIQNDECFCCLIPNGNNFAQAINCGDSKYDIAFHYMNKDNKKYCIAKDTDHTATKVCSSFNYNGSRATWNIATPEGNKTGYTYYRMQ